MSQATIDELMIQLADNWPKVVATAGHWVKRAEEQSRRVNETAPGPNRILEMATWNGDLSQARGALALLRMLRPADPVLEDLWRRLNHCPVVVYTGHFAGPDPQPAAVN